MCLHACSACGFGRVQTPFLQTLGKTLNEISDKPLLLSVWPSAVAGFPERPAQGLLFILEQEVQQGLQRSSKGDFYPWKHRAVPRECGSGVADGRHRGLHTCTAAVVTPRL